MQADPAQLVPEHPARVHPELGLAPTAASSTSTRDCPRRRSTSTQAILHAVEHYDLDGVHFDDYFYPYPVAGQTIPDAATFAAHGAGFDDVEAWRRHNVDTFVRTISERIKAAKPWVKFGISPFGIWRNARHRPARLRHRRLAVVRPAVRRHPQVGLEGWLDYINPQIYWQFGLAVADYAKLVPWWADVAAASGTHLYIGEALYKVTSGVFTDPAELSNHLAFDRQVDAERAPVHGNVYFSAKHVPADPQGSMTLRARRPLHGAPRSCRRCRGCPRPHVRSTGARRGRARAATACALVVAGRRAGRTAARRRSRSTGSRADASAIDVEDAANLVATVRTTGGSGRNGSTPAAEPGSQLHVRGDRARPGLERDGAESRAHVGVARRAVGVRALSGRGRSSVRAAATAPPWHPSRPERRR